MTPAQASGRYNFVTDVPIQGPTDPGIRAADCWWVNNRIPVKTPACVDCNGLVSPMGQTIRFGGTEALGFGVGDPSATLTSDQQSWVVNALATLHANIVSFTGTTCPGWQDPSANLGAAVGCFQLWYNANANSSVMSGAAAATAIRTDGTLDQETLCALLGVVATHTTDFPHPFPDPQPSCATSPAPAPPAPPPALPPLPVSPPPPVPAPPAVPIVPAQPAHAQKKLSTGTMVGIGVAGAAAVAGIIYAATSGTKRHGKRRR